MKGLLRPRTEAMEWLVPQGESVPAPPDGYVVSFVAFHERGFGTPAHPFLRGILFKYELELQHLNPTGVQHMAVFAAFCEGFLGIEPHFGLWKHLFHAQFETPNESNPPMGCAGFRLRGGDRTRHYIPVPMATSNKKWHGEWFYLKNDPHALLPEFTGRVFTKMHESWEYGASVQQEWKRTEGAVAALRILSERGATGAGVIAMYHRRRVIPLMARRLPLYAMTPDADVAGVVMASGPPSDAEIGQRLREVLDRPKYDWPLPRHPPMMPEPGFVDVEAALSSVRIF